jgi:hypothetical protein
MDPITNTVVGILGKYALDKGATLAQEVGRKAAEAAQEMLQLVLDRIGQEKPETAAEFPKDPETYLKPLEKALQAQVAADQALAAQLQALLAKYEQAAQAHAASAGTRITQHGAGAVAGPGGAAATTGGIAVAGDVHGGIRTSGRGTEETEGEPEI